jgi:hypothetical protein
MAHINKIETESIQVGLAGAPPIAGVDIWPSMDPTVPFTMQTFGINNHFALTNQIGLYNGIGLQSITGLSSLFGFKTGVGGQANAEPANTNACPAYTISAASGKLFGGWTLNGSAICVAPCSDISLKKNITPLQNSLNKVLNLQGVSFDWKEELIPYLVQQEGVHQVGLIAQEVEQVAPELVGNTNIEGNEAKTVKYQNLTALLVEAIKEQQEQINTLKQTVHELSTKLENCCP